VQRRQTSSWKFFTSHGQQLLCIAQDGDITLRDLGEEVGITERAVGRIVADLVESGFIERQRIGRRNHYAINPRTTMRQVTQPEQIRRCSISSNNTSNPTLSEKQTR
jgi:DNA-binding MarR family transcriptional regulator